MCNQLKFSEEKTNIWFETTQTHKRDVNDWWVDNTSAACSNTSNLETVSI